jgi:1-acyl-sn-glycerol-3-phosphate acyltransferase
VVSALFLVLGSWLLLGPRSWAMAGLSAHGSTCVWLLEKIVGTRLEVRGAENLAPGALLVASKHQSAWDTFALVPLLHDPAIIMKRELMWIPFYGWFSAKFGMIFVRREAGPSALRRMGSDAMERAEAGRQILIFPAAGHALRADGAQFRPLLAAQEPEALPRHNYCRIPETHSARLAAQGVCRTP